MRKTCTALLLALAVGGLPAPVLAHGGEDHGDENPAAATTAVPPAGDKPMRLADGSVFLPKPSQRLFDVRTVAARVATQRASVILQGQVSADPNAAGSVQATQTGRLRAGPSGLPVLGQRVQAGEILAYVEPLAGSLERADRKADLAELDGQLLIARQRLARLRQLAGSVPQRQIDEAAAELDSLGKRRRALAAGLADAEPLRAPIAGVVSSSGLMAGAVVEAREQLAEIVDPQRLFVTALAFDPAVVSQLQRASGRAGTQALQLQFLGAGRRLQEQAVPLQFRLLPPVPALAIGQPVQVLVESGEPVQGIAVPRGAVSPHGGGGELLWVHVSAERFVPRQVQVRPLDAQRLLVTQGLAAGERVVSQGATLLGQVR